MRIEVIIKQYIVVLISTREKELFDWKTFGEEMQKFLDPDWWFNMVNFLFDYGYFFLLLPVSTLKLHGKHYLI